MTASASAPELLTTAEAYVDRGWHVFPVRAGAKVPLVEHGFKDATLDMTQVREWWQRWPNANIAIATDQSDLLVVDVDCHKRPIDINAWLHGRAWPATYTVQTGHGGLQFFFRQPVDHRVGCSTDGLAVNIDTRGVGGYVVVPPSITEHRYAVMHDLPVAALPAWIGDALRKPQPPTPPLVSPTTVAATGWVTAYGSKALDSECLALAATTTGRNDKLNRVAFRMGQLIAANHLDADTVERRLLSAANSASVRGDHPLTEREVVHTIRSGITAGLARPATNRAEPPPRTVSAKAVRPATTKRRLICQPLEQYTDPPPDFLWGNRLTVGGLTIIAGDGGIGKSFLTTNLAVAFATGVGLPDHGPHDRGSSVIISYEDPGEVIYKRARDMGYDSAAARHGAIEAIYAPEAFRDDNDAPVQLAPHDVDELADHLRLKPGLRLVVVDPLMSFVGGDVDTNKDQQVRAVLHKLTALADDLKAAVVVVAHTVKGTPDPSRALDAIAGSAGIKNIARSALIVMRDPEDNRNYLFHRKHNWTAPAPALEYRFSDGHFDWVGRANDSMLEQICGRSTVNPIDRCAKWLVELLTDGTHASTEVMRRGQERGFAPNTIRSAQRQLGVKAIKEPQYQGRWYWELPDDMT